MADALVSQFVEFLTSMAKEEVRMLLGAEDALRQLKEDVRAFSGVLRDAERRAFTDHAFRRWLADVKDLVYDADDIIDYSRTHAEKFFRMSTEEHPVLCYTPMLLFFRKIALRHRMGNSIRSVNVRLEGIRKRKSDLNPIDAAAPRDDHDHRGSSGNQRQTSPILFEPDIVGSGIEKDATDLVGLLTWGEEELGGPRRRIPIVAITGMGGVGKTTLAQKIYNHNTIKDSFREPPPMWVCVSQQYSNEKLLKEIISNAGGEDLERDSSLAQLQIRLARVIEGKKLFLILDDVWDAKVWYNLLRNPLQTAAAAGSRVLITTRQQSVASRMEAIHLHPVHPLTDEESWSLLCKLVGFQEDGGEVGEIGRQIAKKCDGLPLAINTIAGVLRTKSRTYREWEKVRTDLANSQWNSLEELPDEVMGVLYLSYQDLPFHLKQCFIFCSLFPEDHVIEREQLTQLWVAEGFIAVKGGEDVCLEDIADDYYNELLSRSLLQPIGHSEDEDGDEGKCKMHDLLRSLAQFLAGVEYFVGDVSQLVNATNTPSSSSSSSMKLRHLFIDDIIGHDVVTQVVKERQSLRTLLLYDGTEDTDDTMDFLFSKLGCLRVLDFSDSNVRSLPKSVGNLIQLRYLNLSYSYHLVDLPETVGNLSNLQYLILKNCKKLKKLPRGIAKLYKLRSLVLSYSSLEELPETVGNLSNLQHLILNNCDDLKKLPRGISKLYKLRVLDLEECSEVDGLPAGIGRLQHLNCLPKFVTNEGKDGGWCSLEELSSLSQLRGTLTIEHLERALPLIRGQPSSSRGFILKHLSHLRHLKLGCDFDYQRLHGDDDEKQKIQLIFEVELFPPPSLETFGIYGYFGLKLPSWHLPNLTRLLLENCRYLKQLPALGQLPNLNELSIVEARSVESIGPEFMGMGVGALAFPMLRRLELDSMDNLVEWQWEAEDGVVVAMPRLEELNIKFCPNLRCLPGGLGSVTTLTTLLITCADSLSVVENLHSLKVLKVIGCKNLTRVSSLPALQDMEVDECKAREVEGLYSLQSLFIQTYRIESLPGWLLLKGGQPAFPMLQSLSIRVYENVQVLLHRCLVDGPDWPKIQHYPQVDITQGYRSELFVRYTKDPFTFTTNLDGDSSAGDGGATGDTEN